MSQNSNSTREVVMNFSIDVIYGAFLFIIVYGIAVGVSELAYWCSTTCSNAKLIFSIATVIKIIMVSADTILMIAYIYSQTLKSLKELKLVCKDF